MLFICHNKEDLTSVQKCISMLHRYNELLTCLQALPHNDMVSDKAGFKKYCEWLCICHALSTAWKASACTCIQICCSAPSHSLAQLPQSAPGLDGLQHAACRLVRIAGPALSLPLHPSRLLLHCPISGALQPYSQQVKGPLML